VVSRKNESASQNRLLTVTGPSYTNFDVFDLSVMQPYNLDYMYEHFSKISKEIVAYLPRNSNLNQIARHASSIQTIPVVHYCMNGASKVSDCPKTGK
jgi:trimethylguanosine synthase